MAKEFVRTFPKIKSKKKKSYKSLPKTKSIIQFDKSCYISQFTNTPCDYGLEFHHVMFGSDRRKSELDGLTVWSCPSHHRGQDGVHMNKDIDRALKKVSQLCYESEIGTREEFTTRYGKNYI